jgi:hypothetical protein
VSTLRDDFAGCPRCGEPLDPGADRVNCAACKGVMIEDQYLRPVIEQSLAVPLDALPLEERSAKDPALICPACRTPMTTHTLYGIEIDRCAKHGLWFDGDELRRVLEEAAKKSAIPRTTTAQKVIGGAYFAGIIALNIVRFLYFR